MTFVLECHDVGRRFADGQEQRDVLRNFSAQWSLGSFVGIGGPSGAGKSTLLGILAGLDSSYTGSVKLDGRELCELSDGARAQLRQRHVAFAFQTPHLFPHLSIRQNLEVAADISDSHQRLEEHLREFAERLSLQGLLEKPPKRSQAERDDGQAFFERCSHPRIFSSSTSREHISTRDFKGE